MTAILVFRSGRKKSKNLVEVRRYLASCQVLSNSVQRLKRSKNALISQSEIRRPPWCPDRPEKYKLIKGRLVLAICQVSSNSNQRRSRKYPSQSEAGRPALFFDRPPKNTNFVEDVVFLLSVEVRQIPFIGSVRLGYCFTPYQRLWLYNGAPLVAFYDTLGIRRTYSPLKHPVSSWGVHRFRGETENIPTNERPGGHIEISISRKNTNLVEDVFLLPV